MLQEARGGLARALLSCFWACAVASFSQLGCSADSHANEADGRGDTRTARAENGGCFGPWGPARNVNDEAYYISDTGEAVSCATTSSSDHTTNSQCVNTGSADMHPGLSPDGLSLYISSNRPGTTGDFDIWVSRWDSGRAEWGPAQNLGPHINSSEAEWAPNISADGHWLLFTRAPTTGNPQACAYDPTTGEAFDPTQCQFIWVSYRKDVTDDLGWERAQPLGNKIGTINDPRFDSNAPRLFIDPASGDVSVYFNSCLRGGDANCSPSSRPNFDEYVSTWSPPDGGESRSAAAFFGGAMFPAGDAVTALDSPYRDTPTAVESDGLELLVTSNRRGDTNAQYDTLGLLDLFVSRRSSTLGQAWSTPVDLNFDATYYDDRGNLQPCCNPETNTCVTDPALLAQCVNGPYNDGAPALSSDGMTLYFYSERPAPTNSGYTDCLAGAATFGSHCRNLWVAKRAPVACGTN